MLIKQRKNVNQAFLQRHTIKREEKHLIPAICTIATNSYCVSQIDQRRDVTGYNFDCVHQFDANSEFFDISMYKTDRDLHFETFVMRGQNNRFYYSTYAGITNCPFSLIKRDLGNLNFDSTLDLTNSQYQSAELLFDILQSMDTYNMNNFCNRIVQNNDDVLDDIMQKLDIAFGLQ